MVTEIYHPPYNESNLRPLIGKHICAVCHNDTFYQGIITDIRDGHVIISGKQAEVSKANIRKAKKAFKQSKNKKSQPELSSIGYPGPLGFGYPGAGVGYGARGFESIAIPFILLAILFSGPFFGGFGWY